MTHQPPDASVPAPLSEHEEAALRVAVSVLPNDYPDKPLTWPVEIVARLLATIDAERQARAADPREEGLRSLAREGAALMHLQRIGVLPRHSGTFDDCQDIRCVKAREVLAATPARAAAPAPEDDEPCGRCGVWRRFHGHGEIQGPEYSRDHEWRAAAEPAGLPLDAAWAEAEAALPNGWVLELGDWLAEPHHQVERYEALAMPYDYAHDDEKLIAHAPTPAAALHSLAEKLRALASPATSQGTPEEEQ